MSFSEIAAFTIKIAVSPEKQMKNKISSNRTGDLSAGCDFHPNSNLPQTSPFHLQSFQFFFFFFFNFPLFFCLSPPPFFLFYLCLCLVFVFMSVFMQNSVFDSCRGFEKVGARRRALGNVRECSRVEDASFPRNQLAMEKQLHPSASLRASQRILDNISWVCLLFPLLIVFVFHCLFVGWGFFFCFQIVCHLSRN